MFGRKLEVPQERDETFHDNTLPAKLNTIEALKQQNAQDLDLMVDELERERTSRDLSPTSPKAQTRKVSESLLHKESISAGTPHTPSHPSHRQGDHRGRSQACVNDLLMVAVVRGVTSDELCKMVS